MPDHRDGYRLVNALFPVFEKLPSRQQALFVELMTEPGAGASALSGDPELAHDLQEAREHFRTRLRGSRPA